MNFPAEEGGMPEVRQTFFFPLKQATSQCGPCASMAVLVCLCLLLAGCAMGDGRVVARHLAEQRGFTPLKLTDGPYVIQAWLRPGQGKTVRIYIEGDGFAWRTRTTPSDDPTPRRPMGFALAASDSANDPVCYVGRPCQYVEGEDRKLCEQESWTADRYSESAVRSLDAAVDQLKSITGAGSVMLYGYSGGGAMAALLAERREDVVFFATVAGNLEVADWTRFHQISSLTGSLDPADNKQKTAHIPQVHVVGGRDKIIPPHFAHQWCEGLPADLCKVVELPEMAHDSAWDQMSWEWRCPSSLTP